MKMIQLESRVGDDGVLDVRVPLGKDEGGNKVRVTIEPLPSTNDDWHAFLEQTYGSCASLGLDRPSQGLFEIREVPRSPSQMD